MTVEELANKRYGGEFVFMFGHLEGRTRFVFECFDPRPDHEGNYKLKVYAGNCIVQLNANPKDSSESFFDVYDKDETKLIYGIEIGILKGMFGI